MEVISRYAKLVHRARIQLQDAKRNWNWQAIACNWHEMHFPWQIRCVLSQKVFVCQLVRRRGVAPDPDLRLEEPWAHEPEWCDL
jgi:hypothetical protein